jgi:transposase-like protein
MREYPMTFDEFITRFNTEEQCREYLFGLRWKNGFVCPKCKADAYWAVNEALYECTRCGRQASITAGTIFQDTRKPLRTWFIGIWWITTQKYGASAEGLKQVLGLGSYQTAWTWLHKTRTAMVRAERGQLSGNVEVDEGYIGGEEHSGSTGRGTGNKVLVIVAVELKDENKLGRVRLAVIDDASEASIKPFVLANIASGSNVITDGWSSFSFLKGKGYSHTVYVQGKAESEDERLPHVHLIISLLKRWLLGTHQGAVSEKHMQAYLEEYTFRFNRRKAAKRGLLFYRLLEGAVSTQPITYRQLVEMTEDDELP